MASPCGEKLRLRFPPAFEMNKNPRNFFPPPASGMEKKYRHQLPTTGPHPRCLE